MVCRFDYEGEGFRNRLGQARRVAIFRMSQRGKMSVDQLARFFGMTPRTIWRSNALAVSERAEFTDEELRALLRLSAPELFEDRVEDLGWQLPLVEWEVQLQI